MTLSSIFEQVAGKPVEDRTYNIGEVSQKTGLMKTANGWVEPPKGKNGAPAPREMREREAMRRSKEFREHKEKIEKENPRTETGAPKSNAESKKLNNEDLENEYRKLDDLDNKGELDIEGQKKKRELGREIANRMNSGSLSVPETTSETRERKQKEELAKLNGDEGNKDSAPRALTGDCKVRIRK